MFLAASTVIFELYIVVPYIENFDNFLIKKYYVPTLLPLLFFYEIFDIVLIFRLRRIGLKNKTRKYHPFEEGYGPKKVFT
jgi:hypothetical protein